MIMGYLEIHYEPECTDSVLTCIGLGYGKFLSDLAFTADSEYKQDDDYPETLFHKRMSELLEGLSGNAVAFFRGASRTHGEPAGLSFPLYVSCHGQGAFQTDMP